MQPNKVRVSTNGAGGFHKILPNQVNIIEKGNTTINHTNRHRRIISTHSRHKAELRFIFNALQGTTKIRPTGNLDSVVGMQGFHTLVHLFDRTVYRHSIQRKVNRGIPLDTGTNQHTTSDDYFLPPLVPHETSNRDQIGYATLPTNRNARSPVDMYQVTPHST